MATSASAQPTAAARDRALAIPELLEKILIGLPEQDLLVNATRVSKNWYALIDHSPQLQQRLFFEPAPGPKRLRLINPGLGREGGYSDRSTGAQHTIRLNPLHRRPWFAHGYRDQGPWASYRRMLLCQPPVHEYGGIEKDEGIMLNDIPKRYVMSLLNQPLIGVELIDTA